MSARINHPKYIIIMPRSIEWGIVFSYAIHLLLFFALIYPSQVIYPQGIAFVGAKHSCIARGYIHHYVCWFVQTPSHFFHSHHLASRVTCHHIALIESLISLLIDRCRNIAPANRYLVVVYPFWNRLAYALICCAYMTCVYLSCLFIFPTML